MNIFTARQQIKQEGKSFYDLPLRVTYYARVSTDLQQQLNSLDNQIEYYEDYICSHPEWTFIPGYVDEGISGISTKKREHFNEMMDDARNGMFDLIITKEVSRFARNTLDSLMFTRELINTGVAVFFQNDNINTLDEDGELRLTIMSSLAQDESRKISSRVRFGHQQAIRKGVVLGNSNIIGYRKLNKHLIIDEEQAAVVRELFELYATGKYSMKQLERYFYSNGVRNSKGKLLSHTTMSSVISNPKYKGYYCGNKVYIADMFSKKQIFLPEEDWVMYKDETGKIVPAIVSEELWERANAVLRMRSQDVKQKKNKTTHHNLLTGKLYCTHCGRPYYRKNSNSKTNHSNSTWRCSGKINNGADSCPSCSLFENELLPVIETTFLESHNNIRTLSSRMLKLTDEILRSEDHTEQVISLNHDIEQEKKKKQKLLQYNIDGQISDAEYLCQLACCNREIDNLQEKISVLSENNPQNQDLSLKLVKAYAILLFAENNLAPEEIDRPFVDRFIREILVTADGNIVRLEIHLNTGTTVIKEIVRSEKHKEKKYTTLD